ncbi:hypothetical protein V8G54_017952 [Vigna mungo]|uniref:Uncharacterized protein n=1 Tax=Vigna mungo TaxID=3915 RepID=A0AAQ3RUB4_VIGMU
MAVRPDMELTSSITHLDTGIFLEEAEKVKTEMRSLRHPWLLAPGQRGEQVNQGPRSPSNSPHLHCVTATVEPAAPSSCIFFAPLNHHDIIKRSKSRSTTPPPSSSSSQIRCASPSRSIITILTESPRRPN